MTEKEEALKEILRLLSDRYPMGLYEYLFRHRGELYKQLLKLEERLDKALLSGTVEETKAALRDYWVLHMKAIKEFKQATKSELDLSQAREQMKQERLKA